MYVIFIIARFLNTYTLIIFFLCTSLHTKGDDITTFIVPNVEKIRSLNLLYPQGPAQACSGKTLLCFDFTAHNKNFWKKCVMNL